MGTLTSRRKGVFTAFALKLELFSIQSLLKYNSYMKRLCDSFARVNLSPAVGATFPWTRDPLLPRGLEYRQSDPKTKNTLTVLAKFVRMNIRWIDLTIDYVG